MNNVFLLKQGEIVLKGQNRSSFEQRLVANIKRRLAPYGDFDVWRSQSTVYAEPRGVCDESGALQAASRIFGIVAVTLAAACEKDEDAIFETARTYLESGLKKARSFKVESKRADKRFHLTSIELSQHIGGRLHDAFPETAVDVKNPELTVNIEIREKAAYVHAAQIPGAGGMPVGSNGRAVTLLSGGIDSPVASYMAAKRGLSLIPVHFHSFPYTSQAAKEKVIELAGILTGWCGNMKLECVSLTKIQEEIAKNCPEAYFTILLRRFMTRISEKIALSNGCNAIITGESLGQVASQTAESMAVTQECVSLPVLRPLICFDKEEIVKLARKIGTFDTSVLPYEDCCSTFTPRHPKTKPRLGDVLAAESALDIAALEEEALSSVERISV